MAASSTPEGTQMGLLRGFDGLLVPTLQDYAPIRQSYEDFYTRRVFYRLHVSGFTRGSWFRIHAGQMPPPISSRLQPMLCI